MHFSTARHNKVRNLVTNNLDRGFLMANTGVMRVTSLNDGHGSAPQCLAHRCAPNSLFCNILPVTRAKSRFCVPVGDIPRCNFNKTWILLDSALKKLHDPSRFKYKQLGTLNSTPATRQDLHD